MALKVSITMMTLIVLLATSQWPGTVVAQSSCTSALVSMASCLNFITGGSSSPSASCCSRLANVVQSSPQCLCSALNGGLPSLGIAINQTLALSLPGACKIQTPPISQCKAASAPTVSSIVPSASPTNAPDTDDFSGETPEASVAPSRSEFSSGAGSKSVPSTGGSAPNASIKKTPPFLLVILLFMVSSASALIKF